MLGKKRSNYKLNQNYFYSDKKAELMRRASEIREWCNRRIGAGCYWYPVFKGETDIDQKTWNKIMNGNIFLTYENDIESIENVIKMIDAGEL